MRLRRVEESDLPALERLVGDPEATQPFIWDGWRPVGDFSRRWRENGLLGQGGVQVLMVCCDDEVVGLVSWRRMEIGRESHCWNIGIVIAAESRGKGYGSAAQSALVRYLFANTMVNRVEAETEVDNVGEQRALEKAGFTREGVRRGLRLRNGVWRDYVMYGVVRSEVEPESDPTVVV